MPRGEGSDCRTRSLSFPSPPWGGIAREATAPGFPDPAPGSSASGLLLPGAHPAFRMAGKESRVCGGVGCPTPLALTPGVRALLRQECGPGPPPQVPSPVPRPSGSKASPGLSSSMRGSPCSLRMTLQKNREVIPGLVTCPQGPRGPLTPSSVP